MENNSSKITFGIVLVIVGLIFLARTLGLVSSGEMGRMIAAFALIGFGLYLIIRKRRQEQIVADRRAQASAAAGTDPGPEVRSATFAFTATVDTGSRSESTTSGVYDHKLSEKPQSATDAGLRYSKLLGDMFIDAGGLRFENIEISTGIGDLELRLRGARLAAALNRVVISGFIGDLRIYLPRDMAYSATCSNFIGNIEVAGKRTEGFGNNISSFSADYDTASQKLYIAANSFIGDIRVMIVD